MFRLASSTKDRCSYPCPCTSLVETFAGIHFQIFTSNVPPDEATPRNIPVVLNGIT